MACKKNELSKANPVHNERLVLVAQQCNVMQHCDCEADYFQGIYIKNILYGKKLLPLKGVYSCMVTSLNRDYKRINQSSVQEMMQTVKARSELLTALCLLVYNPPSFCEWVPMFQRNAALPWTVRTLMISALRFFKTVGTTRPITEHHIPKDINPQINIFKFKVNFVTMR